MITFLWFDEFSHCGIDDFTSIRDLNTSPTLVLKQKLVSNQLCILDEFELGQDEIFPSIKDAPSLEVTSTF